MTFKEIVSVIYEVVIGDPELELKLINFRLRNESIFENSKDPWKDLQKLMVKDGFNADIPLVDIREKWKSIIYDYHKAVENNDTEWIYYSAFRIHVDTMENIIDYTKWNDYWMIKLVETRCKNDSMFLHTNCDNNIGWIAIESDLKKLGLPAEYDVMCIKNMWFSLIEIFKKSFKIYPSGEKCFDPWPVYEDIYLYFMKYNPEALRSMKTESHELSLNSFSNTISESSDSNDSDFEQDMCAKSNDDTKSHSGEFRWNFEWTEKFIRIRSENEHLFKKKYGAWKKLHNILMKNGFPSIITSDQLVTKWSFLYNKYQKAVADNSTSWIYFDIMSKYLEKPRRKIKWNDEWTKSLIQIRIEMDNMFKEEQSRVEKECWIAVKTKLIANGIFLDDDIHNIERVWSCLVKTFKDRHKLISENRSTKRWKFYDDMFEYFVKCTPNFFNSSESLHIVNVKVENDNEVKDGHKREPFIKVEYFDSDSCRVCLGSFETTSPLFGTDENIAEKIMSCTGMRISPTDNLPQKLCQTCMEQLNVAMIFRKKCEESDKQMKQLLMSSESHEYSYDMHLVDTKLEKDSDESVNSLDLNFSYVTEDNNDNRVSEKETDKSNNSDDMDLNYASDSNNENWINKKKLKKNKSKIRINKAMNSSRTEIGKKSVLKVKRKRIVNKNCTNKPSSTIDRKKYVYYKMCEICGRVTSKLKIHMLSHTTEKMFKCPTCSSTFRYLGNLRSHMRVHETTPHKVCQICGREFSKTVVYKRHLLKHDSQRYSCNICNRSFNTPDVLAVHKRIHTGEKPHACDICGKHFYTKACVRRHQKVHRNLEKQTKMQE